MNFVFIAGHLGKDPETRFTADGTKVTTLVVATHSKKSGKEDTIWWRVTVWGDRFDKMMTYFKKGSAIMVKGELFKPETYVDKNGVVQIGSLEVRADSLHFSPFGKPDQNVIEGKGFGKNVLRYKQIIETGKNEQSGINQESFCEVRYHFLLIHLKIVPGSSGRKGHSTK